MLSKRKCAAHDTNDQLSDRTLLCCGRIGGMAGTLSFQTKTSTPASHLPDGAAEPYARSAASNRPWTPDQSVRQHF